MRNQARRFLLAALLSSQWIILSAQPIYTFNGGGPDKNWRTASNWAGMVVPPDVLSSSEIILIFSPVILDTNQTIDGVLVATDSLYLTGAKSLVISASGTAIFSGAVFQTDGMLEMHGTISNTISMTHGGGAWTLESGGTLTNTGVINNTFGVLLIDGGGALSNEGSMTNAAAGTLEIGGILVNETTGTITNDGQMDILGGAGTLDNFGTLVVNGVLSRGTGAFSQYAGATLTGSGSIDMNGSALVNNGTIIPGNSVGTLTITGDLTNSGTLQMEVAGLGSFDQIIVSGTATINGTVNVDFGTYVPTPGSMFALISAAAYAGSVTLSINPAFISGTLTNGILTTGTVPYVFQTAGNWSVASNWAGGVVPPNPVVSEGVVIAANCTQDMSGRNIRTSLTVNPMVTLTLDNTLTIQTASSTMTLNGTVIVGAAVFNIEGDLDNNGSITINSNGTMNIQDTGGFINDGTLTNDGTFRNRGQMTNNISIANNGNTFVSGDSAGDQMTNNGTITNTNSIENDRTLTNNGTLINSAGADFLNRDGSGVLVNGAVGAISNDGTFTNRNDLTNNGTVINTGTFDACEGTGDTFNNNAIVTNSGTLTRGANNAILNNNVGGTIQGDGVIALTGSSAFVNGGTLSGAFSITNGGAGGGHLSNPGMIIVGGAGSIGTASVAGTFVNSGTIDMEITGTSGTNDVLAVSGVGTIGGTLNVALQSGSVDNGDSYNLLTYASRSGTFATVNLPTPPMGSSWTTNDNPTVFNITYAGGPALPIELISFTGNRRDAVIELRWRTGSEFNNYYMAVERSADGIEFAEIGRVQGLGTTDGVKDYAFTDHAPFNGINYYRLRQVDFDGTTEIHPTISVLFKGEASFGLYLYPNPATDQIQVRLDGATDQETKIRIFDLMGREYARFTIPAGAFQKELPVHALPAGTFFLQAVQGGKTATGKVVKQ